MPAPRIYIGSAEIAELLGVSLREAQYMMAAFRDKGVTVQIGRKTKVSLKHFARHMCKMDGSTEQETYDMMRQAMLAKAAGM